jgi:DNA-binding transcriptional LysR family regulator
MSVAGMELRDIEYFAIVAEQRHFGRAAEILGLSQPALSKSLKRLEQSLHVKLMMRTPKGVDLTPEGSALLRRVHDVRLAFQGVAREIADVNQGYVGYLRIGAGAVMSEQFLSTVFTALLANAPRTRLKVVVSDNDVMIPALRTGELDIIVNYVPHEIPDSMIFEHLYDDPQLVCASTKHRLAAKSNLTLNDLEQEQWALNEPTVEANLWLQARFHNRGLSPPKTAFESRSAALRIHTVAASNLLAFVPHSAIRLAVSSGLKVAPLAVEELKRSRQIGAGYRKEVYRPPIVDRFLKILKTAAKQAIG